MSGIIGRLLAVAVLLALSSAERQGDFLIELSPAMDGRKVKPYNISLNINGSLNHSLSVSSVNFRKNVTLGMQLFAWYNGGWILKKARLLQITDKKALTLPIETLLMKLTKARSRKSSVAKQQLVLRAADIYVSHDPEGSLMTSQLEEPSLFIPSSSYTLVDSISKDLTKVEVPLVFKVIPKTDVFIDNRRHLAELAELRTKVEEVLPLVAKQMEGANTEPSQILDWATKNINSLAALQKRVEDKLTLMEKYGLRPLLALEVDKVELSRDCPTLEGQLKQYKLNYQENVVLSWKWIFQQQVIRQRIEDIREQVLLNPGELTSSDAIQGMVKAVEGQATAAWIVGGLWILVDLGSYWLIQGNLGLSRSYGTFLNLWLLVELLSWAVRIGFSLKWSIGLGVFLLGLALHWAVLHFLQGRFESTLTKGSHFDVLATGLFKNSLIAVMLFSIFMHNYSGINIDSSVLMKEGLQVMKRAKGTVNVMVFWCFSQFASLLAEYYYVLAVLPQIMLNFRLRSVEKAAILRVALLLGLSWMKSPSCYDLCGVDAALGLKEGFLAIVLLLQFLLFRNSPKVELIRIQEEDQGEEGSSAPLKRE